MLPVLYEKAKNTCPPDADEMNFSVFYSLYSLKSKYNYPLGTSWYTVFRRNSRFIQDKSVAGNRKSSGLEVLMGSKMLNNRLESQ